MRIGFANNPRREVLGEIEWIGRNGFDFVDLFLEPDRAAVETIEPARLREALDRLHLEAMGHLAYYLPIASPLPQLRKAAVDAAREYLEVFAGIGVPAVTVHSHWPPRMFSAKEGLGWQMESLRAILDTAKALDVRIMYEPLDTEHDAPEHIETILTELPELLLHLDLGHSNLFGRNPAAMIRRFAARLHHIHLHDNDGRSDQHLPPGAGNIDWRAVMRALREARYDRTITLEIFSRDRDYVLLAKEKVKAWWAGEMGAR
jgi:sugar phosphate isomerase/epimerase